MHDIRVLDPPSDFLEKHVMSDVVEGPDKLIPLSRTHGTTSTRW
jgi:hypothetical protein